MSKSPLHVVPIPKDFPNIDDSSNEELLETVKTLDKLKEYIKLRVSARRLRTTGNIPMALLAEHNSDEIYKDLPGWAKW